MSLDTSVAARPGTTRRPRGRGRYRPTPASRVRSDVQGLRAIAVLAVVADHFAGWPRGGFVGVDVFFVISGFLITDLLLREYERTGTISFTGFYKRRIKRIMPAAVFVLIVALGAGYALLNHSRFASLRVDALESFLFFGNWHFANTGVDYFQKDLPPSPLQHFWSLAVEEQYYIVWPWLLLGLLLLGVWRGWWRGSDSRMVSGIAAGVITAASLGWALHQSISNPTVAYFSTFCRAWELGIGALVAIVGARLAPRTTAARIGLAWAGLAGIAASLFLISDTSRFPAPWALLPVLATAAVLAARVPAESRALLPIANRVSDYLGNISYSLYLWHFVVATLLVIVYPYRSAGYWVFGIVLMFGLSALSYRLIETPARKGTWFRSGLVPRAGWLQYGCGVLLVVIISLLGRQLVDANDRVLEAAPVALDTHGQADADNCVGAAALDPSHRCALNTGSAVTPLPANAAKDSLGAFSCYSAQGEKMRECQFGSKRKDALQVVLVGDSHAASLLPALESQLEALNWHLTIYVGNSCSLRVARDSEAACPSLPDYVDAIAKQHPDVVLATNRRGPAYVELQPLIVAEMSALEQAGIQVVVIGDNPTVPASTIACLNALSYTPTGHCGMSAQDAYADPDGLAMAAAAVPGVQVLDTRRFFCPDDWCSATIGNVIVYRDVGGHITGTYARTFGPYLADALTQLMPEHR